MSDDNQQKGGNATAKSITGKVENEIRKGKLKSLESKAKGIIEEINSAEAIVTMKKEELKHLFEDHSNILDS